MRGMFARNYEESIKGKEVKPQGDISIGGQDYKIHEDIQVFNRREPEKEMIKR